MNIINIVTLNEGTILFKYQTSKGNKAIPIKNEKNIFSSFSNLKLLKIKYIGKKRSKNIPKIVLKPVTPKRIKENNKIINNATIAKFLLFIFIFKGTGMESHLDLINNYPLFYISYDIFLHKSR